MNYTSPLAELAQAQRRADPQRAAKAQYITEKDPPRDGQISIVKESTGKTVMVDAKILIMTNGEVVFHCASDQARGQQLALHVCLLKSKDGENIVNASAVANKTRRLNNGYEFIGKLRNAYHSFHTTTHIFADFAANHNANGWNHWSAPLTEGVTIERLNLRGTDLSMFDLCCCRFVNCDLSNCNLSGANLSGSDLSSCKLDGVTVEGTDLFGAILPKRYEYLPEASGALEKESITLV